MDKQVRMQLGSSETSILKIISATYRGEGLRGFFKGMMSPVVTAIPYNSLVFTTYEYTRRKIDEYQLDLSRETQSFLSGLVAGG